MTLGIRARVVAITITILLVTIGVKTLISNRVFRKEYLAALRSEVRVIGGNLKSEMQRLLQLGMSVDDIRGFEEQCQEVLREHKDIAYAMIVAGDGRISFHNDPSRHGQDVSEPEILKALSSSQETMCISKADGETYYNMIVPVQGASDGIRIAVIVGFPTKLIDGKVQGLMAYSFGVAFASLVTATIVLVASLSASVTRPLSKLLTAIQEIRDGADLAATVEVTSRDEIGQFASAFNKMTQDLRRTTVSRDYVDSIIQSMSDMLIVVAPGGIISMVNRATCDLLGYAEEELVGRPMRITGEAQKGSARIGPLLEESIREGDFRNRETCFLARDGRRIPMLSSASSMKDKEGRMVCRIFTAKDIAERKRIEEEIHRAKEALEEANATLEQRVAKRTAELVEANQRLRQAQTDLVQSEKMSMLGQLVAGVAHEINTPTGAILNVTVDAREHLGGLVRSWVGAGELPAETREWLLDLVPRVLSDRHAASEASMRKRRREIERQLRRKGLARYRQAAEVIVSCGLAEPSLDDRVLAHLEQEPVLSFLEHLSALWLSAQLSLGSARKIARIVRALRFYARTGQEELVEMDVNESIDNTLVILQNRLKHLVEVRTEFGEGLPAVMGGPELSQVWTNILNNACDAVAESRSEGLGLIEIVTRAEDGRVVVAISNDAPPIPDELISKIYDPFFTTKPIGKGTGLGLSICMAVLRRYGGTIAVRNTPSGVTFEVSLPAGASLKQPREAPGAPRLLAPAGSGKGK